MELYLLYILYIVSVLLAIATICIAKHKYNFLFNHYFFFNVSWLTFIFLSLFFNSYTIQVDTFVYLIFLLGLLSFNFTVLFIKKKNSDICERIYLDITWRRVLEIIVIVGLFPAAYKNYQLIQSGTELWQLNYEYWHEYRSEGSYIYQQFQQLFLAPLTVMLVSTSFYRLYYNVKNNQIILVNLLISIFISILYLLLSGGGRAEMMFLFYCVVLSVLSLYNNLVKRSIFSINKSVLVGLLLFFIVAIQWANEGRGKSGGFIQNAIDGQIIFAPLFEYYLNSTDVFKNNTFGASMFEPIVLILQLPFKLFGIIFYESNNSIVQQMVYVSSLNKESNAAVSAYFYYFRDFGLWGIFLGPVITAFLFNWIYSFCRKNSFYLLFYSCAVLSLCLNTGYGFNKPFFLAFVYMILFCKIAKRNL